jgi:hypothetical protein
MNKPVDIFLRENGFEIEERRGNNEPKWKARDGRVLLESEALTDILNSAMKQKKEPG